MRIICILEYKGFHHNGAVIINRLKHGSDLLPVNVSSATGDAAVGFPGVKMRKAMVVGCITYGVGHVNPHAGAATGTNSDENGAARFPFSATMGLREANYKAR